MKCLLVFWIAMNPASLFFRAALEDETLEADRIRYHGHGGVGGGGGGHGGSAMLDVASTLGIDHLIDGGGGGAGGVHGKTPRSASRMSNVRKSTLSTSHASLTKNSSTSGD